MSSRAYGLPSELSCKPTGLLPHPKIPASALESETFDRRAWCSRRSRRRKRTKIVIPKGLSWAAKRRALYTEVEVDQCHHQSIRSSAPTSANESAEPPNLLLARSCLHLPQKHPLDISVPGKRSAAGIPSLSQRSDYQFRRHPHCTMTPNLSSFQSTYTCAHHASQARSPVTGTRDLKPVLTT